MDDEENDSSFEDGEREEEEEYLRFSDIAITKLNSKNLQKGIENLITKEIKDFGEAVYKVLQNRFEKYTKCEFNPPERIRSENDNIFFNLTHCVVTKKKIPDMQDVDKDPDKNRGEIWFLYWGENVKDLNIYCFLRSKSVNAWEILTNYRNFDFPKTFSKAFLDPKKIKKIKTSSLIGADRGSQNKIYSKDNVFDPAYVIDRFATVEEMKTPIDSQRDCSKKLISYLNITDNPDKIYVAVQQGQIKLPMEIQRKFKPRQRDLDMVKFIHETIQKNEGDFMNDPQWRFLDLCKFDNSTQFNEKLKHALLELYKNPDQEIDLIDLNSRLTYIHEDSFESKDVKLLYKSNQCYWKTGKTLKGLAIIVRDVLDGLHSQNIILTDPDDIDNITLSFYDDAKGKEVKEKLINMLMSVDLVKDTGSNQRYTLIKCGVHVYKVTLDSYYEVFYRFVDAVNECLTEDDDVKPDILQWNLEKANFTIDELYQFCKVNNNIKSEDAGASKPQTEKLRFILRDILCEDTSLFEQHSKDNNVLDTLDNNNNNNNDNNNNNNNHNNHSSQLICLNRILITKSTLYKKLENFSKKSGTASSGEKTTSKSNEADTSKNKEARERKKNKAKKNSNSSSEKGASKINKDILSLKDCKGTDKAIQDMLTEKNRQSNNAKGVKTEVFKLRLASTAIKLRIHI